MVLDGIKDLLEKKPLQERPVVETSKSLELLSEEALQKARAAYATEPKPIKEVEPGALNLKRKQISPTEIQSTPMTVSESLDGQHRIGQAEVRR